MIKDIYSERDLLLKKLGYTSYSEYLSSQEWKEIKAKVHSRNKRKWKFCNICGTNWDLELHHSSYKVIGNPNPGNTVKLLCRGCHQEVHDYSKSHPNRSLYSCFSRIRNARKQKGLPVFTFVK